jgi:hypothetical protein
MHRAEFWETFRDCLSKLPVRVADVFMLREIEEMDSAQICEALRISSNHLWVTLHRARMALRECLEINWFKRQKEEGSDERREAPSPTGNPSVLVLRNWLQSALVKFFGKTYPKMPRIASALPEHIDAVYFRDSDPFIKGTDKADASRKSA